MNAHEHPLPSDPVQAKAVIFELMRPEAFTVYRDTTWRIISTLAFPTPLQVAGMEPRLELSNYSGLRTYMRSR